MSKDLEEYGLMTKEIYKKSKMTELILKTKIENGVCVHEAYLDGKEIDSRKNGDKTIEKMLREYRLINGIIRNGNPIGSIEIKITLQNAN